MNQAGINLGLLMVLPYLAAYLTDGLGMAAATVGLVLGARTLSQQGHFLPSGALVDRVGPWPSIVAGCGLRVVAFGMFGVLRDPVSVVVSVLLIGVAGALFTPAVRKYLALESPDRRAENSAAFEVLGNVGALLGPVLGAGALLLADFQTVCLVAEQPPGSRGPARWSHRIPGRCQPLLTAATPHTNCTPTLVSPPHPTRG